MPNLRGTDHHDTGGITPQSRYTLPMPQNYQAATQGGAQTVSIDHRDLIMRVTWEFAE
jgi:hypothetical protein